MPILLLVPALRRHPHILLWAGIGIQSVTTLAVLGCWAGGRRLSMHAVLGLYLLALLWLWPAAFLFTDWCVHLAVGVLLIVVLATAGQLLVWSSGAAHMRRVRLAVARLARRRNWPDDLRECRTQLEVQRLREALADDPSPALTLLFDTRPAVQVATLAALERRKHWTNEHAGFILGVARRSSEPEVRAGALTTLIHAHRRPIIDGMAEFLRDPDAEVRQTAAAVLLADPGPRWQWIRGAVQSVLADPSFAADGPLVRPAPNLSLEAVSDLTGWAAQKGTLAVRAALTLQAYYRHAIETLPTEQLLIDVRRQLSDPQSPAGLRTELAQMLHQHRLWDRELQEQLLNPLNPAPLRLVAAGALLTQGGHAGAITALRELARLPNREIALATAELVQKYLGVDLGLPIGQPVPPVHTRLAAEVTRRVMAWASERETDTPMVSTLRSKVIG